MKLRRIKLQDVRAIGKAEFDLAPSGVTLVVGPNEAGKSTIRDAIHLALSEKSTSTKQIIKDLQPEGRDVGPCIELEFETGPYHLTYRVQYLKDKTSTLKVQSPKSESKTGPEAFNRLQEILDETTDRQLWEALSIVQGESLALAAIEGSSTLAHALDEQASEEGHEKKSTIWDNVHELWASLVTKKGDIRADPRKPIDELEKSQERLDTARRDYEHVEQAAERLESVYDEIGQAEARVEKARKHAEEVQEQLTALDRLENDLKLAKAKQAAAEKALKDAKKEVEHRAAGNKQLNELDDKIQAKQKEQEALEIPKIEDDVEALRASAKESKEAAETATNELSRLQADQKFRDDEFNMGLLENRLKAAKKTQQKLEEDRKAAAAAINETKLRAIRKQDIEVQAKERQAEQDAPILRVTALEDLDLVTPDRQTLKSGESFEQPVLRDLEIQVGNIAKVAVTPGSSGEDMEAQLGAAREKLKTMLDEVGASSSQEAAEKAAKAEHAKAMVEEHEATLKDHLQDFKGVPEMESKVDEVRIRIDTYAKQHGSDRTIPDREQIKTNVVEAQANHDDAVASHKVAKNELDARTKALNDAKDLRQELGADVKEMNGRRNAVLDELKTRVAAEGDDDLQQRMSTCEEELKAKEKGVTDIFKRMQDLEPSSLRAQHATAGEALRQQQKILGDLRTERDKCEGKLEQFDATGKANVDELEAEEQTLVETVARLNRRVEAVKLLYSVMARKRLEEQQRYVQPLHEQANALAAIVFGEGADIEIDPETLQPSRLARSERGAFQIHRLSTGTREQVSMIHRLAIAQLVAGEQGVPVFFDDALGWSDPKRRPKLNAVIHSAGGAVQIVVLTCDDERYMTLAPAVTHRLHA